MTYLLQQMKRDVLLNCFVPSRGANNGLLVSRKTGRVKMEGYTNSQIIRNSFFGGDYWEKVDTELKEAKRQPNLLLPLFESQGLKQTGLEWHEMVLVDKMKNGNTTLAQQVMDLDVQKHLLGNDLIERRHPIPITHIDYRVASRERAVILNSPLAYERGIIRSMAEDVLETLDRSILFGATQNGLPLTFGGAISYGLVSEPNTITTTVAGLGTGGWSIIDNIKDTILRMIGVLESSENSDGPYGVLINTSDYRKTQNDFPSKDGTPYESILEIPDVQFVSKAPYLADGNVIVFELNYNMIRYAEHQPIQVVEFDNDDGSSHRIRVQAVGGPIVNSDYNDNTSVIVVTDVNT